MTNTTKPLQPIISQTRCEAVAEQLRNLILSGHYAENEKIPPERELAVMFRVNRLTVSKALSSLANEELLVRKVGSGTYVKQRSEMAGLKINLINVAMELPYLGEDSDESSLLGRPGLAEAVYECFRNQAMKVAVSYYRDDRELSALLFQFARERNSAHIIWYVPGSGVSDGLRALQKRGHAFCLVDARDSEVECSCVGTDNRLGGQLAMRELLESGHRSLLYLTNPMTRSTLKDRYSGAWSEAEKYGASVSVMECGFGAPDCEAVAALIKERRITAVFAGNDSLALRLVAEMPALGVSIPEDVSLIGFDDLAATQFCRPPLSTMRQDFHRIGLAAAEIVDGMITTGEAATSVVNIAPLLVRRKSVRAV
ncbi:MAG: GntR family transcriptional regulator [Planctomycetes bacterium]|nr:GntR family transcriptional regulator [Planctomycetota bacterium]